MPYGCLSFPPVCLQLCLLPHLSSVRCYFPKGSFTGIIGRSYTCHKEAETGVPCDCADTPVASLGHLLA